MLQHGLVIKTLEANFCREHRSSPRRQHHRHQNRDRRSIEIQFTAPYTGIYQIRAYASSAPPNSLQIYSSVSILESGPNVIVLTVGIAFFVVGAILLSVSLLKKPEKTAKVS